jgi:hypothetical protein
VIGLAISGEKIEEVLARIESVIDKANAPVASVSAYPSFIPPPMRLDIDPILPAAPSVKPPPASSPVSSDGYPCPPPPPDVPLDMWEAWWRQACIQNQGPGAQPQQPLGDHLPGESSPPSFEASAGHPTWDSSSSSGSSSSNGSSSSSGGSSSSSSSSSSNGGGSGGYPSYRPPPESLHTAPSASSFAPSPPPPSYPSDRPAASYPSHRPAPEAIHTQRQRVDVPPPLEPARGAQQWSCPACGSANNPNSTICETCRCARAPSDAHSSFPHNRAPPMSPPPPYHHAFVPKFASMSDSQLASELKQFGMSLVLSH